MQLHIKEKCKTGGQLQVEGGIEMINTEDDERSLLVFTFNADASLATTSGVYRLNDRVCFYHCSLLELVITSR